MSRLWCFGRKGIQRPRQLSSRHAPCQARENSRARSPVRARSVSNSVRPVTRRISGRRKSPRLDCGALPRIASRQSLLVTAFPRIAAASPRRSSSAPHHPYRSRQAVDQLSTATVLAASCFSSAVVENKIPRRRGDVRPLRLYLTHIRLVISDMVLKLSGAGKASNAPQQSQGPPRRRAAGKSSSSSSPPSARRRVGPRAQRYQALVPLETIRRRRFRDDAAALFALVDRHGVGGPAVGLPLALAGGDNAPRTQVRQFARNVWRCAICRLRSELTAGAKHQRTTWDTKRRAEIVDRVAAAYILQNCPRDRTPRPMTPSLSSALRLFGLLLGDHLFSAGWSRAQILAQLDPFSVLSAGSPCSGGAGSPSSSTPRLGAVSPRETDPSRALSTVLDWRSDQYNRRRCCSRPSLTEVS